MRDVTEHVAPEAKRLACCGRAPQLCEYLLADARGIICVGCYLADHLEAQDGRSPQSDTVRSVALLIPKDRVARLRALADGDPAPGRAN